MEPSLLCISDKLMKLYFSVAGILCVPYREIYQIYITQLGTIFDTPIVCSNLRRMSDMVKQRVNKVTFENCNIDDLARAIVELSSSKEKMSRYSEGFMLISIRDFSIEDRTMKPTVV